MIVELYKFSEYLLGGGSEQTQTYTSGQLEQEYNFETYVPRTMGRSKIEDKSEITKSELSVDFAIDDDFAKYFLDDKNTKLTLSMIEYDTESETGSFIFIGELSDISVKKQMISMKFKSKYDHSKRSGLNRLIQRACNHNLYGTQCGLNRNDYQESGTITAISESSGVLTIPGSTLFDPHYFTYGLIEDLSGNACFPLFHNSTTGQILVDKIPQSFLDEFSESGSVSVYLYPGCRKSLYECQQKFSNSANFGGFPFMPLSNPFEADRFV